MNRIIFFASVLLFSTVTQAQNNDFALGADISWTTEMESRGEKVYNVEGEERECTALMKEMGLNAIRLRVWVDPSDHGNWCNKQDVLVKAKRAKALGMDIMMAAMGWCHIMRGPAYRITSRMRSRISGL